MWYGFVLWDLLFCDGCVWLDDDDGAMQGVSISSFSVSTVKGNDIDLGDAIVGVFRVDAGSW